MWRKVDELRGLTIHATDGDIGRVHDVYFDDHRWTVLYLVVDTRHWLTGRRILLSRTAIRKADWAGGEIVVALSREQIGRSPSVETDQPIGQKRIALFRECYSLPYYWALGGFLWQPGSAPHAGPPRDVRPPKAVHGSDPHLRSARALRDYGVKGTEGDVGHVEGFLMDDSCWALRGVVVKTRHWPAGKRVLVPCELIAWVSWIELAVHVDLPTARVLNAPEYEPSRPVTGPDETRLSAYYGRSPHSLVP